MKAPTLLDRLLRRPQGQAALATVTAQVDDSPGWSRFSASASNERDAAEIQEQYQDALTAWRKNPFAKRIIDITTRPLDKKEGQEHASHPSGQLPSRRNYFVRRFQCLCASSYSSSTLMSAKIRSCHSR